MTNDQRLKNVEAAVDRIEGMLTKMTKPVVWQYDADHGTDEERSDWAKKLSESLENNSMPIVPTDVPATASQVAELKAMVKELMDEVMRPSTFVPSCSIGGKEVACDAPVGGVEISAACGYVVTSVYPNGSVIEEAVIDPVIGPPFKVPTGGVGEICRATGNAYYESRPSAPDPVGELTPNDGKLKTLVLPEDVADTEFLKKMEEAIKTGGTVVVDAPEGGTFRLPPQKVEEAKPEVEPTTMPVASPPHGKKRKH